MNAGQGYRILQPYEVVREADEWRADRWEPWFGGIDDGERWTGRTVADIRASIPNPHLEIRRRGES